MDTYDYSHQWPEESEDFDKWITGLEETVLVPPTCRFNFSPRMAKVTGKMDNVTSASCPSSPRISPIVLLGNCKQLHQLLLEGSGATSTDICIRSVLRALHKATGEDGTLLYFTEQATARCFNDGPCMKRARSAENTYSYECHGPSL